VSWDTLVVGLLSNENSLSYLVVLVAAILTAILSAYLYHRSDRNRRNIEKTSDFIDEFYSKEFIMHRRALWNMQLKVQDEKNEYA